MAPITSGTHEGNGFFVLVFTLYFALFSYCVSIMKFVVFILLVAILISLGSGLFYLTGKNHDSRKVQRALRIRVALSAILILFLVVSYLMGWLQA